MSQKILPNMICRIVNAPPNNNRLVRTIEVSPWDGDWLVECLEHIDGWTTVVRLDLQTGDPFVNKPKRLTPGACMAAPEANLRPLYDGDEQDEMICIAGRAPFDSTRV